MTDQNNVWYLVGIAITAIITPILTGLFGYWKLKRLGINHDNIAEIQDRAAFRAALLKRVNTLENQLSNLLEQERELIATCARQEIEIIDLKREQEELREQLKSKEQELRSLRSRVTGIEQLNTGDGK